MSEYQPNVNIVTMTAVGPVIATVGLLALFRFKETGKFSFENVDEKTRSRVWLFWAVIVEAAFVITVVSVTIALAFYSIHAPETIGLEVQR